jgi:hypothetical protein
MRSIGDHLKKYASLGALQKTHSDQCLEVIRSFISDPEMLVRVSIKNSVLFVHCPAPFKVLLRGKKKAILQCISEKLSNVVKDIAL